MGLHLDEKPLTEPIYSFRECILVYKVRSQNLLLDSARFIRGEIKVLSSVWGQNANVFHLMDGYIF